MRAEGLLVRDLSDGAVLVAYPGSSDEEANRMAVAAAQSLARKKIPGLLDAVPGARTLLLLFDPAVLRHERLAEEFRSRRPGSGSADLPGRTLHVPVLYGGEAGPDLEDLARGAELSPREFIHRHAAEKYRVAFLGFAPGFPYLVGLPSKLSAPRLATPRKRVPAGSVGIGGGYTGIYPEETPGGWRLIGRAPVRLFDARKDPPALLLPGDIVRFRPIEAEEFARGRSLLESSKTAASPVGHPGFRVASPGVWTSVQGAPRYGWSRYGVAPGGAMDIEALRRGNAILGNPAGSPALEITLSGPRLEVLRDGVVALSGASCEAELDGKLLPGEQAHPVRAGESLRLGRVRGGARAYLCVAGGLAGGDPPERALPSRRLNAGDTVCGSAVQRSTDRFLSSREQILPFAQDDSDTRDGAVTLRVVLGPQEESFEKESLAAFLNERYRVSADSDRRGMRLEGPRIVHRGTPDIAPEGTPPGGIQVPRDGQPIVLGPDRPVTGGYAKIATVIGADLPFLAQATPGTAFRFRAVGLAEALAARSRMAR